MVIIVTYGSSDRQVVISPFYRCTSEDSVAPVFMSAWCFLSKIPHLLGLNPTHIDCEIAGSTVGSPGVRHAGRWMLQGDVTQLHSTWQPDHHLTLVALKSPAIPREHIWLQADRELIRIRGLSDFALSSLGTGSHCAPSAPAHTPARPTSFQPDPALPGSVLHLQPGPLPR